MDREQRFEELDSLRGLAALSVLLFHLVFIFPMSHIVMNIFEYSPLRILVSGTEAVILFFVLSGYVLSLNFYKKRTFSYRVYLTKRIFRIYPAYYFATFVGMLGVLLMFKKKITSLSEWYNLLWTGNININILLDHAALVKSFVSNINPVTWSLIHEMRISIIFPLIIFALMKMNWKQEIFFILCFFGISVILFIITGAGNSAVTFINTLHYIPTFIAGALIAKYFSNITEKISRMSTLKKLLFVMVGLFLYLYAKPSFVFASFIYPSISPFYKTIMDEIFVATGSVLIIIFTLTSNRVKNILRSGIIKYLGKISYSLYLIHVPVIIVSLQFLHGKIHPILICAIVLVASITTSSLIYHSIEKPFVAIGSRISLKLSTWNFISKKTTSKSKAIS